VTQHVLAGRAPFKDARGTGEEADLVDHGRQLFAGSQRIRLAGVLGLEVHELVGAGFDRISELQQRLLTLAGGRVAPHLEGRGSSGIRAIHIRC